MKQIFFLLFIFTAIYSNAQNNNKIQFKIIYNFKHLRDTNNKTAIHNEEQILYIGKTSSLYRSYTRMYDDSIRRLRVSEAMNASGNDVVNLSNLNYTIRAFTYESYFVNFKTNKTSKWIRFRSANFAIEDSTKKIIWNIENETKLIDKFNCQKATCTFYGRKYTAWFTTEIPGKSGPWKLNGLPGTILEAIDETKQVSFTFNRILNYVKKDEAVALPTDAIVTNKAKFKKMIEAYNANPEAFEKNNPINSNVSVSAVRIGGSKPKPYLEELIPNPIELKDN